MKRIALLCAALTMLVSPLALGQNVNGFYDADVDYYRNLKFDAVTGYPITMSYPPATGLDVNVHDGSANAIDSRTGALSVVQEDGSGSLVAVATAALQTAANALFATMDASLTVIAGDTTSIDGKTPALGQALSAASVPTVLASDHSTINVNTATGTLVDSTAVAQQDRWLDITDGSSQDSNYGVIPNASIIAGTPVKLYDVPEGKQYHEITITYTDSAAGDFDYDVIIFAVNDIPSAAWALNDWMSVGALVVPSWKLSRDRTETLVAQPLIQTRAAYLVVIIDAVVAAPATDPLVRILSYNDGDQ